MCLGSTPIFLCQIPQKIQLIAASIREVSCLRSLFFAGKQRMVS